MTFDIIEYVKGLTAYQYDDAVYNRIVYDRGVSGVTEFGSLAKRDIDLITADLLYVAYTAPTTTASINQSHGGFSQSYGAQVIGNRENLYNIISSIYKKYGDEKLLDITEQSGTVQFINETENENF